MNSIPHGWMSATLGQVVTLKNKKINPTIYDAIPYIGLEEVEPHTGKILELKTTEALKSSVALFEEGDILYGKLRPYLNKVVIAETGGAASPEFLILRPAPFIDSEYLKIQLMAKDFVKYATLHSSGDRPRVSFSTIESYIILVPPLSEQVRIVEKYKVLQEKIIRVEHILTMTINLLNKYGELILSKAVTGKLTDSWRQINDYTNRTLELTEVDKTNKFNSLLAKYYEIKAAGIKGAKPQPFKSPANMSVTQKKLLWNLPDNWFWTQLGNICFVTKLAGFEYSKYVKYTPTGDLKVIKAENVSLKGFKDTDFSFVNSAEVAHLERSTLYGNELLISFVGNVGQVGLVPNDQKYFLGPNVCFARPYSDEILSRYLELFYRSRQGKSLLLSSAKSVAQSSLSMTNIRTTPIAIPSREEQIEIIKLVDIIEEKVENIQACIVNLKALRKSYQNLILEKALSGKLVAQKSDDIPVEIVNLQETDFKGNGININLKRSELKTKTMTKKITDILLEAIDWLSAQEIFLQCGIEYNSTTEEIEVLYSELRNLDQLGLIFIEIEKDSAGRKLYDKIKLNKELYNAS